MPNCLIGRVTLRYLIATVQDPKWDGERVGFNPSYCFLGVDLARGGMYRLICLMRNRDRRRERKSLKDRDIRVLQLRPSDKSQGL